LRRRACSRSAMRRGGESIGQPACSWTSDARGPGSPPRPGRKGPHFLRVGSIRRRRPFRVRHLRAFAKARGRMERNRAMTGRALSWMVVALLLGPRLAFAGPLPLVVDVENSKGLRTGDAVTF